MLSKVVINFTLPAVILVNITSTQLTLHFLILPILPFCFALLGTFLGGILFRNFPDRLKGLMMLCTMGMNIGVFALPIIEGLFGAEGVRVAALYDMGNALTIFGVSYLIGSHYSPLRKKEKRSLWDIIRILAKSTPFMTYIVAICINLTGVILPDAVRELLTIPAKSNHFLVLLILGLVLNFDWKNIRGKGVVKLLLLRYFTALVLGVLICFFLPFDPVTRKVTIICLILPTAFLIVPYAHQFGYDEEAASGIANLSLVFGFFLMWGLAVLI